ncbi:hypothetical protein DN523_17210 [Burkholderia multivorans]|nr:hypothetical protein [Burkholderia multivorans]RAA23866.1 hypothetical protein DN470_18360 [Burkholderia multivorans]RAA31292.1 hypothetical protein DN465_21015 [Burkholderia multivorans]RAA31578.1 hypothetical protein DN471_05555 [Burkholderia multivorans]RAA41420.1 hypothetical protein DN500_20525 [Burkholderia multivorans]
MRDRIRVVATLNELLTRVATVENANQFARWFDGIMRKQRPLLPWETEESGKWRKNFAGNVALNPESIEHLQELFPDGRYYSAVGLCGREQETRVAYPVSRGSAPMRVRELYDAGPGRLWEALWAHSEALSKLWEVYPPNSLWGPSERFTDVLAELSMKLWSGSRCGVEIEFEDLGRAIVLYRLELAGIAGSPDDGVDAYLLVRLAMAELSPTLRCLGVWDDLASYIIDMEHDRIRLHPQYAAIIETRYSTGHPFDVYAYVENPFLAMLGMVQGEPSLTRHMEGIAGLSQYQVRCRSLDLI